MANNRGKFTVIQGGVSTEGQGAWIPEGTSSETGIYAADGTQYYKETPGPSSSGGGGPMKLTLPDLRWNVALLNAASVLFTAALVGMFLWMVDRIDDKFDDVMKPLTEVQKSVAKQEANFESVDDKLDRLLDRKENEIRQPAVPEPSPQGK